MLGTWRTYWRLPIFLVPLESGDLPHPEDWAMTHWSEAVRSKKKSATGSIADDSGLKMRVVPLWKRFSFVFTI